MVLILDNYDSFTWNLAHRLGELGAEVTVVRNDAMTVDDIVASAPARVVVSPGPGRPESAGVSVALVQRLAGRVPILGVCLGHQALSVAFGGRVERAPELMHGKTSVVDHEGTHLFAGVPAGIYTLSFSKTGYQTSTLVDFTVTPEQLDRADFKLPPLAEAAPEGEPGKKTRAERLEEIPDAVSGRRLKPQDPGKPSDTRVLIVKVRLEEPTPLKLGQRVEVEIGG